MAAPCPPCPSCICLAAPGCAQTRTPAPPLSLSDILHEMHQKGELKKALEGCKLADD